MTEMKSSEDIDFSLLLASSVHDIKNSLSMLLSSLDEMIAGQSAHNSEEEKSFGILRGEASRINNALIHLLGIYRLQHRQLNLNLREIYVRDFLEEQIASQQLLFEVNHINVTLQCDDTLTAYFDEQLVAGIIANILVNCAKYTNDQIELIAQADGGGIIIQILDNGRGYPEALLSNLDNSQRGLDFDTGSTNLGLFFAQSIAKLHQCNDQCGSIRLSNRSEGGGCFSLFLP